MALRQRGQRIKGRSEKAIDAKSDPVFVRLFADFIPRGYQRKFDIIQAAIKLISEGGIHTLTFEAIAQEIGVGRSHVAYHFRRLADLHLTAFKYVIDTVHQATIAEIQKRQTPREQVVAPIRALFSWAQEDLARPRALAALFHLAGHTPECARLHSQIRIAGQMRLAELIVRYRPELSVRKDEVELICRITQALCLGAVIALGSMDADALSVIPTWQDIGADHLKKLDELKAN